MKPRRGNDLLLWSFCLLSFAILPSVCFVTVPRKIPFQKTASYTNSRWLCKAEAGPGNGVILANLSNTQLESVKNCRDLASVGGNLIQPGRIFRTGFLSNASDNDVKFFKEYLGLKTVIDLRSPRELREDKGLLNHTIFKNFEEINVNHPDMEYNDSCLIEPKKQRYYISLMDEKKYKWGAVRKLSKRNKAKVVLYLFGGLLSKRVFKKARDIIVRRINEGGLSLLNELLLLYSGEKVCQCLKILATPERHPVAIHCTAGKDRTGFVSMLVLKVMGTPDEAIVNDYMLSGNAYADLNDRNAMVGALKQEDLDPDKFLCAPGYVIEDTIDCIIKQHGSIEKYLDSIGFNQNWRDKLRKSLSSV